MSLADITCSLLLLSTNSHVHVYGLFSLSSRLHQAFNPLSTKHLSPRSSMTAPQVHGHPPRILIPAGHGRPQTLPGLLFPIPEHHHVLLALGREEGRLLPAGQLVHEGCKGWVLHLAHHCQGQWSLRERGQQGHKQGSLTTRWMPVLSLKLRVLNQEERSGICLFSTQSKQEAQTTSDTRNKPFQGLGHRYPWQLKVRWSG